MSREDRIIAVRRGVYITEDELSQNPARQERESARAPSSPPPEPGQEKQEAGEPSFNVLFPPASEKFTFTPPSTEEEAAPEAKRPSLSDPLFQQRAAQPVADEAPAADTLAAELLAEVEAQAPAAVPYYDEPPAPSRAPLVLFAIGSVWTLFFAWLILFSGAIEPSLAALPGLVAGFSMPLVLLGIAAILLVRGSRAEAIRFASTAQALQQETLALDVRLKAMHEQLAAAGEAMSAQADTLQQRSIATASEFRGAASELAERLRDVTQQSEGLQKAGTRLTGDLGSIETSLPSLEQRAAAMSAQLVACTTTAEEKLVLLEARIEAITALADSARTQTSNATKSLTAQLNQVTEATRGASEEISGMADLAANRMDMTLERVRTTLDGTREGLADQSDALARLVEQARTTLSTVGKDAMDTVDGHSETVAKRLRVLNKLLDHQSQLAGRLGEGLQAVLTDLTEQFGTMEKDGLSRNERLGKAITMLTAEAERMQRALEGGNSAADGLISRSEALLTALDSGTREIDETLPHALSRLEQRFAQTRQILGQARPDIEHIEAVADAIVGRVTEAESLSRAQARALDEWLDSAQRGLIAQRDELNRLSTTLADTDSQATRLAQQSGPQLIEALLRVKDTAEQAAERARQALSRAIPDAADALADASATAMEQALAGKVTAQLNQIAAAADQAMSAAHHASERLMQQMLTLTEASSAMEKRVEQARDEAEARDSDSFARRVSLLIESLNSTAIDVGKLLSNDVTDASWAAYLKGDRGVFTRRAVRLLDSGEAREIGRHYDEDPEFREHVNRYIHDFEAMLRSILSTREGSALAVAMLSSDTGKLYVALAQAIERLRN